ncbi:hypothetical protein PIB30_022938 [Stylosanthes scabra]|uniref:Uncharacterized protein n=1 Tax=Stylosanthes scabra TaxID=79078 RepID=A0ABU6R9K7_9FABA|nr:hypothetical protein [Stylosanthes scabra]
MSSNSRDDVLPEEAAAFERVRGLIAAARARRPNWISLDQRRRWIQSPDHDMRLMNLARNHSTAVELIQPRDWSRVVLWESNQITHRNLCDTLQLPTPGYEEQIARHHEAGLVSRFIAAIPPGLGPIPSIHAAGKYSADEVLAREDAASALFTRLLGDTGTVIGNYNNEILKHYRRRNSDFSEENKRLQHENCRIHCANMEPRSGDDGEYYNRCETSGSDTD